MKKSTVFFTSIVLCMAFVMQSTQCFAENYWNKNYIGVDEHLDWSETRISDNGQYILRFQPDGNLVLLKRVNNSYSQVLWASGSFGKGGTKCLMQADGNLVIYTGNNTPIWHSNTVGHSGACLVLQDDGNVVIYEDMQQRKNSLWSTNTAGK